MAGNVIDEVLDRGFCSGCGVCVGACPVGNLESAWMHNGDMGVIAQGTCIESCRACLEVCPFFSSHAEKERVVEETFARRKGIKRNDLTGFFRSAFAGYSLCGHRERGASGGMVSWLLEVLLREGLVDAVVCPTNDGGGEYHFRFQIISEIDEVLSASGSKYYPVSIGMALREMAKGNDDRSYGVVGLPCLVFALRLAMEKEAKLKRRIRFLVGLVCNHLPNRFYTDYLIRLSGLQPGPMKEITYRSKKGADRASNYKFLATDLQGKTGSPVPFLGRVNRAWKYRYFQMNACNFCDDIFSEAADIAFMDAWLPEYERDPAGHSFIIVRDPSLADLLVAGAREGRCKLDPQPIERIIRSQEGNVVFKRHLLPGRIHYFLSKGLPVPRNMSSYSKETCGRNARVISAYHTCQEKSKALWRAYGGRNLLLFEVMMLLHAYPLLSSDFRAKVARLVAEPHRLTEKLGIPNRKNQDRVKGPHEQPIPWDKSGEAP